MLCSNINFEESFDQKSFDNILSNFPLSNYNIGTKFFCCFLSNGLFSSSKSTQATRLLAPMCFGSEAQGGAVIKLVVAGVAGRRDHSFTQATTLENTICSIKCVVHVFNSPIGSVPGIRDTCFLQYCGKRGNSPHMACWWSRARWWGHPPT